MVKPCSNDIFYDLGCGSGKAVFTAALLYPDINVRGVEFLSPLYELCLRLASNLKDLMQKKSYFKDRPLHVELINKDILETDFSDANIVFINATCFETDSWNKICDKFDKLAVGARVIISTKYLESDKFELIHERSHLMSWGLNTMNIYKKIS